MRMKRAAVLEIVEEIRNQLVEKYRPEKIILFGSSTRNFEDVNDIDLFIIKRDVPYYGSDRIMEIYRIMDTAAPVDYLVYTPEEAEERLALGDPFIRKIYAEGKVLYG